MTKKNLLIALKFAVSIGLIAYLVTLIDLGAAKDRILAANLLLLVLSAAVLLFQSAIGSIRWWIVCKAVGGDLPVLTLWRLFYIGTFFSQALPSSVGGDPIRMYMAYKRGQTLSKAINCVLLERVVTVLGLVILVSIIQPFFLPKLEPMQQRLMVTALVLLAGGAVLGVLFLAFLDRLPEGLHRFRIVRGFGSLAVDTRSLFFNPVNIFAALVFGVITHLNISTCVYLIAVSMSLSVTWIDCLVLMPPVLLVTTLPISIGGWGVREGAMVTAFALIGVTADAALVLSIAMGLVAIVVALPGGLIWLLSRTRGETVTASEAAEAVEADMMRSSDDQNMSRD